MAEHWIYIGSYKEKPTLLEDFYVETQGCGCCAEMKHTPSKEDLDVVEKNLDEQMEIVSYLRDKYYSEG